MDTPRRLRLMNEALSAADAERNELREIARLCLTQFECVNRHTRYGEPGMEPAWWTAWRDVCHRFQAVLERPPRGEDEKPPVPRSLGWDAVGDRLVSSAVVSCSAAVDPPLLQYETIIWEWDGERRGRMLHQIFHLDERRARRAHGHIVGNLTKDELNGQTGKETRHGRELG